jgi:hypothetical protein
MTVPKQLSPIQSTENLSACLEITPFSLAQPFRAGAAKRNILQGASAFFSSWLKPSHKPAKPGFHGLFCLMFPVINDWANEKNTPKTM